jgi:hypothetical protein
MRTTSERGSALIMVAIAIVVLTGFSAFVLDYGVMWLGRGQSQNGADAGALAGAVARAFDDTANPPAVNGIAFTSATLAAEANPVVGDTPGVVVNWECPPYAAGGRCVRVDVFRDGTNNSTPLPTFFANIFGVGTQSVRATATAHVAYGNATNCMRPFAVADKWSENPLTTPNQYNRWTSAGGNAVELNPHDSYTPTGYKTHNADGSVADLGVELVMKGGNNPNSNTDPITPGWFLAIRLPDGDGGYISGGSDFREAIATCIGNAVTVGQYLPVEAGAMIGPARQGFDDLKAQDPLAVWNDSLDRVDDTCAPECAPFSPRIVPITVFDIDDFQRRRASGDWSVCPTGGRCVKVVNILGFFANRRTGQDIVGNLVMHPGEFVQGAPAVGEDAAFLVSVQLIR